MLEFTLIHELECSPQRLWDLFFDEAFTRELIVDGLGFASCEVEPTQELDGKRHRAMHVVPTIDVPAAVAKLLGPKLGYTETGVYDPEQGTWTFTLRLSVLGERIRMGGSVAAEPLAGAEGPEPERTRRVTRLWVDAKILGLGGLVERAAEKNLRDGWNKSALWMNTWLDAHRG